MRNKTWILLSAITIGCASSYPVPNDQMAAAQKEVGRAEQSGATSVPDAKLHLQLAQENISKAKSFMEKDNRRATVLLQRAGAEAELAFSLATQESARADANQTIDQLGKAKEK